MARLPNQTREGLTLKVTTAMGVSRRGTADPGVGTVRWRTHDGRDRSEIASQFLLHEPFDEAMPLRVGVQYQNRLNRHSRQFFSPQGSHVWCESALEAEA